MTATVGGNADQVRIVPLGGLGEIGLNLMVLECGGEAIIVDAGVMFGQDRVLGGGIVAPDLAHLERNRPEIRGIIATHAHEDHIGAIPHLIRRFPAPIFGSEVTIAFARRRLNQAGTGAAAAADLRVISPRAPFQLGPFTVEAIRVTHSTPESFALAITTPAGLIVHTGDFKIDPQPVDGLHFDRERFAELGAQGVALLLSDSTNVERPGRSGSESSLLPTLREIIGRTRGKFFLTSFSSHLHRIRQVAELSHQVGRYVVPVGRRMAESTRLGVELGQLKFPPGTFIERAEAEFLQARRLTFLASGSQGEPLSALSRIAADTDPGVSVEPGDTVVLSSRFIPGNERAIQALINHLYKRGAEVFYETVAPVHVSGHASRDELAEMIALVRPRYFVPIHGEYRHLARHVALAIEAGVPEANCFLLEDGDTLVMTPRAARRGHEVKVGREPLEESDGDAEILRERRALARQGTVFVVIAVSAKTGEIVAGPDLLSRGVVSGDGTSALMRRAQAGLRQRLRELDVGVRADRPRLAAEVVRTLGEYFHDEFGMHPLVVPCVMQVGETP
jgi:ribonuclease J